MLGLLWVTMVTGFPSVLAGFDWYREGLTLRQVLICCIISIVILMAYTVPACSIGAQSGQTFALLSRRLFGRIGSVIVSLNVAWISIFWYGLTAFFLANGLQGIFHLNIDIMWFSAILAALMSFNNLFGFTGVAYFAGYIAAPVLIVWIVSAFTKAGLSCPSQVWHVAPKESMSHALTLVSAFVIGYSAWGNEPDYWRYSKPKLSFTFIPVLVSLLIGNVLFPVTGWLMAYLTGVTAYGAASELMTKYVFGGISILAAVVLFVTYCAQNDANLYAATNGVANLKEFNRKKLALVLTLLCALCAMILSKSSNSFEAVASMSSTVLPCPTVVMIAEWYFLSQIWRVKPDFRQVPELSTLPPIKVAALLAVLGGSAVGLATAGIIPGLEQLHVGVCSLQAWIATFLIYIVARPIERKFLRQSADPSDPVIEYSPVSMQTTDTSQYQVRLQTPQPD